MVHPNEHRVSIEHPSLLSIAALTNFAFGKMSMLTMTLRTWRGADSWTRALLQVMDISAQ